MMEFRTEVNIPQPPFQIEPLEEMLFVGSCFADNIGQRFREEKFNATVNPYGTMYNPASVLHTVTRFCNEQRDQGQQNGKRLVVFITLGTNHVYRLKETGEIVDNCQKRPQQLFTEEELAIDDCMNYLRQAIEQLRALCPEVKIVFTVSPIRYQKYGFHESQLSKATLLLAIDNLLKEVVPLKQKAVLTLTEKEAQSDCYACYFPAYELVVDELRDYRFYKEDMLHPSAQAVEYIWQQLAAHYFSPAARQFLQEWKPIKEALAHRPFHPEREEYQTFLAANQQKEAELIRRYTKN